MKRIGYLENLRILACVLVVGVHVSAFCLELLPVDSLRFFVMNGLDCLSILGVPLFVMISGALLLSPDYPEDTKKLYGRKIPKLIFLYFFWLCFYNIINFIENSTVLNFENVKQEIVLNTLLGKGIYHLWYLPMMVILYLLVPFLKSFAADKGKCILFCLFCFGYSVFFPTILKFDFPYRTIVESLYTQFDCSAFGGYAGYFMLGHLLHEYLPALSRKKMFATGFAGAVAMGIEIAVCNLWSVKTGVLSTILNTPFSITAFVAAGSIFVLFHGRAKQTDRTDQTGGTKQTARAKLSALTLGIYLIHPFFLRVYGWLGGDTLFAPALVAVPLVVALLTAVSGITVFALSKVPVLKKTVGM